MPLIASEDGSGGVAGFKSNIAQMVMSVAERTIETLLIV
jgi:hypothetical protein